MEMWFKLWRSDVRELHMQATTNGNARQAIGGSETLFYIQREAVGTTTTISRGISS